MHPSAHGWTVVVTRPPDDAAAWVAVLQQAGHSALALPLMAFGPPPDVAALQRCVRELAAQDALMFVSPQAVAAFWQTFAEAKAAYFSDKKEPFTHTLQAKTASVFDFFAPSISAPQPARHAPVVCPLRCWAPGPGTARALRAVGVPASCIDQPLPTAPQFDSEALWQVVEPVVKPGFRVMVVRGHVQGSSAEPEGTTATGQGREWLAERCRQAGAVVSHCVAYSRGQPVWSDSQQEAAVRAAAPGHVWLLTSTEGVGHLAALMPRQDWSGVHALATHPRIAQAARSLGFGFVAESRPSQADVVAALEHMPPHKPLCAAP